MMCYGYSIEAPHWGTSNEYPQHMLSWRNKKNFIRNKKNNLYPCNPQFYNVKVGFKGVKII